MLKLFNLIQAFVTAGVSVARCVALHTTQLGRYLGPLHPGCVHRTSACQLQVERATLAAPSMSHIPPQPYPPPSNCPHSTCCPRGATMLGSTLCSTSSAYLRPSSWRGASAATRQVRRIAAWQAHTLTQQ